jgi:hypothetical protein
MVAVLPETAWERFLRDHDEAALLALIRSLPERPAPRDVEYPEYHRICDIQLGKQAYRISRLVDVVDGEERLFIEAIKTPNLAEPGVPYQLRGEALRHWVVEESEKPAKKPIDWKRYL